MGNRDDRKDHVVVPEALDIRTAGPSNRPRAI
jgi:hypothetical protein